MAAQHVSRMTRMSFSSFYRQAAKWAAKRAEIFLHGPSGQLVVEQFKRDYPGESHYFLWREFTVDAKARKAKEKAGQGVVFHHVDFGDADWRFAKYSVDLSTGIAVRVEERQF
jgi:hypothetical protein